MSINGWHSKISGPLQKMGYKPSAAALRAIIHNIFQLAADKRRTDLTFNIPDSIKGSSYMHGGPLQTLASWNYGTALDPESGVLLKRILRLAGKARQHLTDKPLPVRVRHRHGRSKASTQTIIGQGAVGPAQADLASPSAADGNVDSVIPIEPASENHQDEVQPSTDLAAPAVPAAQEPPVSASEQTCTPSALQTAQPCAAAAAAAVAPALCPVPDAPAHPQLSAHGDSLLVTCKASQATLDASAYQAAYRANAANPKWTAGKAGKESYCKCFAYVDPNGSTLMLTAGAFEKAAGCTNKNAKLSLHVQLPSGPISLKAFDQQVATSMLESA